MDYATRVRRTAADYVDRYGEEAVEFVRRLFVLAHHDSDGEGARRARDVAVAADSLLMARQSDACGRH
jgi:hypothetical protein